MQIKHKILAIGAAVIASAIMSQQPAQAQNKLAGLVRYPTETKELQVSDTLRTLYCQHNSQATELIPLADLPQLERINLHGCANLTNLVILAKIGRKPATTINVFGTKLQKITVLPEQLEEIEVQPTTLKTLQIQIAEAPTQTLQIWQVKDEREETETKAVIFWRGSLLQSKQQWNNEWITHSPFIGDKIIQIRTQTRWSRKEEFYQLYPIPASQPTKQN